MMVDLKVVLKVLLRIVQATVTVLHYLGLVMVGVMEQISLMVMT